MSLGEVGLWESRVAGIEVHEEQLRVLDPVASPHGTNEPRLRGLEAPDHAALPARVQADQITHVAA